jgi:hypothetical protein
MVKSLAASVLLSGLLVIAGPTATSPVPVPAVRVPEPSVISEAILCAAIICFLAWRKHKQSKQKLS